MKQSNRQVPQTSQKQVQEVRTRLYQTMEILGMDLAQLDEAISKIAEDNPVIELVYETEKNRDTGEAAGGSVTNWTEEQEGDRGGRLVANDGRPTEKDGYPGHEYSSRERGYEEGITGQSLEDRPAPTSERERIRELVRTTGGSPEATFLADIVVDGLTENGYLPGGVAEVRQSAREAWPAMPTDSIHDLAAEAVNLVRQVAGPGAAARDLQESLFWQLEHVGMGESLAAQIVKEGMPELAGHRYGVLAKKLGRTEKEVREAEWVIRTLNPRPCHLEAYEGGSPGADLVFFKEAGIWKAETRNLGSARVRISKWHERAARMSPDEETRAYIKAKLEAGKGFIAALEMRQKTMQLIADAIIRRQVPFLERGPGGIYPMTMTELALETGVHKSTISRATNGRWIQTPRGTFAMDTLFNPAVGDTENASTARQIQDVMREMIGMENKQAPLRDGEIQVRLERMGYPISRRTVVKYREAAAIPPARARRTS